MTSRVVVESLAEEFDIVDIAAAAVEMAARLDRGLEGRTTTSPPRRHRVKRTRAIAGRATTGRPAAAAAPTTATVRSGPAPNAGRGGRPASR